MKIFCFIQLFFFLFLFVACESESSKKAQEKEASFEIGVAGEGGMFDVANDIDEIENFIAEKAVSDFYENLPRGQRGFFLQGIEDEVEVELGAGSDLLNFSEDPNIIDPNGVITDGSYFGIGVAIGVAAGAAGLAVYYGVMKSKAVEIQKKQKAWFEKGDFENKIKLENFGAAVSFGMKAMKDAQFKSLTPKEMCKTFFSMGKLGDSYKPGGIHMNLFGGMEGSITQNQNEWTKLTDGEKTRLDFQALLSAQSHYLGKVEGIKAADSYAFALDDPDGKMARLQRSYLLTMTNESVKAGGDAYPKDLTFNEILEKNSIYIGKDEAGEFLNQRYTANTKYESIAYSRTSGSSHLLQVTERSAEMDCKVLGKACNTRLRWGLDFRETPGGTAFKYAFGNGKSHLHGMDAKIQDPKTGKWVQKLYLKSESSGLGTTVEVIDHLLAYGKSLSSKGVGGHNGGRYLGEKVKKLLKSGDLSLLEIMLKSMGDKQSYLETMKSYSAGARSDASKLLGFSDKIEQAKFFKKTIKSKGISWFLAPVSELTNFKKNWSDSIQKLGKNSDAKALYESLPMEEATLFGNERGALVSKELNDFAKSFSEATNISMETGDVTVGKGVGERLSGSWRSKLEAQVKETIEVKNSGPRSVVPGRKRINIKK